VLRGEPARYHVRYLSSEVTSPGTSRFIIRRHVLIPPELRSIRAKYYLMVFVWEIFRLGRFRDEQALIGRYLREAHSHSRSSDQ
jgi:hypothetical protein